MKRNISLMIIVLLSIMLLSSCNDLTHSKPIIENHTDPTSSDCQTGMSFITSTDFSDNETFSERALIIKIHSLKKRKLIMYMLLQLKLLRAILQLTILCEK